MNGAAAIRNEVIQVLVRFSVAQSDRSSRNRRSSIEEEQREINYAKRFRSRKTDRGQWIYPENEAAYWREQHSKQPYAKNSYDQYEHAYRTGYNSYQKYRGRNFDEVEESVANDYESGKPDAALPWDTMRP